MGSPFNKPQFKEEKKLLVFSPTSADIGLAHKRAKKMGTLRGSFTRGMGNMVGCLGEICVEKLLPHSKYVGNTVYSHDFVYKNKRIEVKSKSCNSVPLPHYMASLNLKKGDHPDNDIYVFTRVRKDLIKAWVVGWYPTTKLLKKTKFREKGYTFKDGFVTKVSGHHIPIKKLRPATQLLRGVYK